jgi:hypothetical protein
MSGIVAKETSPHDQNTIKRWAVLIANLIVLIAVIKGWQFYVGDLQVVLKQWGALVPAGGGVFLIAGVNGLLSRRLIALSQVALYVVCGPD